MAELSLGRRRLILAICCLSLLLMSLDNTIVNVALPSIQRSFHSSVSGLQWVIDAYTLVLASLLLVAGAAADRCGRRRTFQVGLALFSLGSLLCSLAPSLGWLVAFRVLQAIGGSMLNPVAMSIITNVFTDPRERAGAIGIWGAVVGVSLGLGPVVGGLLVDAVGWRSIFWVNLPFGLAAAVLAALFVPESRSTHPRRIDPIGQLLVVTVLATLLYAIIEGPSRGWNSGPIVGLLLAAVTASGAFLRYESRRTQPVVELRFFRSLPFSGAVVVALGGYAAFSGYLFLNTLYLQGIRHYSALDAGLCTLPLAVTSLAFAPVSGRLVGARGGRIPLVVAGTAMATAALLLTRLTASTPLAVLLLSYLVFGVGFGMVSSPITDAAVSGMPLSQGGVAAAVASTSGQVGQALGVAIVGSIAGASGSLGPGFARSTHPAWWVVAGCGMLVLAAGLSITGPRAKASAHAFVRAPNGTRGSAERLRR